MKNVLLIGAGKLGKRHLQSLRTSAFDLRIMVVDPSPDSRDAAADAYGSVESVGGDKELEFASNLDELNFEPDVAIIATPATGRLQLLKKSIELGSDYVVLEKVAFNSERDILDAKSLVAAANSTVWVNCPRRLNPIYQKLRAELAGETFSAFRVSGANYGLACNFIHFADLFAFLSGEKDYSLDFSGVESVQQSKRSSYVEFAGRIAGRSVKGAAIDLTCKINEERPEVRIELETVGRHVVVDETGGSISISYQSGAEPSTSPFQQPYQSQLTGPLVDELLKSGTCGLTPFDESMRLHLPYVLGAYELYAEKFTPNAEKMVPIT